MEESASNWNPSRFTLSVVQRPDPAAEGATTLSVRHPTAPFRATIQKSDKIEFRIRELLLEYLKKLDEVATGQLAFPQAWMSSLEHHVRTPIEVKRPDKKCTIPNNSRLGLTWLPLAIENSLGPFSSFSSHEEGKKERTIVVSAVVTLSSDQSKTLQIFPCCPGIGIRIVVHLLPLDETSDQVAKEELRITSMSACLPGGDWESIQNSVLKSDTDTTSCDKEPVDRINETLVVLAEYAPSGKPVPCLKVFRQDPVSQSPKVHTDSIRKRRPTGDKTILQNYLDDSTEVKSASIVAESDSDQWATQRKLIRVMSSDFVRDETDGLSVKGHALRSDAFSAVSGLRNSLELFECLKKFSINPERYFRSAVLPLDVHYRAGMPYGPGKDGRTINAAVQPFDCCDPEAVFWCRHQIAPDINQPPPRLQLRMARATLFHRGREIWQDDEPSPAEPLGIAADPRWMWHELGHVLLMATTGELELRFAHSPGDALAAIVSDPESDFVEDESKVDEAERKKKHRWRGATYPWVFIPRRHDRCVYHGWSWSGAMHRPLRELAVAKQPRRKGYRSEQILSTSLFRLYLCLGGMTPNPTIPEQSQTAVERRQAASDCTLFLIMKGLGLLGDARIVPANDPDQLVSALIDADIGTETFGSGRFKRIGGCAHKVIRWAFEAQGLYAGGAADNNNIGNPPAVDVYIEDRRSTTEIWGECPVEHGPGSYVPVSLEAPEYDNGEAPHWFAAKQAIRVEKEGIYVIVGNRGSESAKDVTVTVFYREWKKGAELPHWVPSDEGGRQEHAHEHWNKIDPTDADRKQNCSGTNDMKFGPFPWPPPVKASRFLILAKATCPGDHANIDADPAAATGLPCSRKPTPLSDLVANDNNLGLIAWSPP